MSVAHFCFSLPLVMFLSPLISRVFIVPEYRGERTYRTYPSSLSDFPPTVFAMSGDKGTGQLSLSLKC
jgi:hypothetical protein